MNIKINKTKSYFGVEYPDEFKESMKDANNIALLTEPVNTAIHEDNEYKLRLCKIIVDGVLKLAEMLINTEEKQLNKEQLINIIRATTYNYENFEQLFTNAMYSIKEMEEGKINNFEIVGIKVSGYNPETKLFSIAA